MGRKPDKIRHIFKPGPGYYLLAFFFPLMFFLVKDSAQLIQGPWPATLGGWLFKSDCLFMFFGVPVLMLLLRRNVIIYDDRVEIYKPALNSRSSYYFHQLISWRAGKLYVYRAGRQGFIILHFANKKIEFNALELRAFNNLIKYLDTHFSEKKIL